MRLILNYRVRLFASALLMSFGICKLLAQVFLGNWEILSAGQSDIAARGIFLLSAFLWEFAAGATVLAVAIVATVTRGTGVNLQTRLIPGAMGGVFGSGAIAVGADPIAALLRTAPWSSSVAYYTVSAAVALIIFALGVVIAVRSARSVRLAPAAA
jgi:hypothetical protein